MQFSRVFRSHRLVGILGLAGGFCCSTIIATGLMLPFISEPAAASSSTAIVVSTDDTLGGGGVTGRENDDIPNDNTSGESSEAPSSEPPEDATPTETDELSDHSTNDPADEPTDDPTDKPLGGPSDSPDVTQSSSEFVSVEATIGVDGSVGAPIGSASITLSGSGLAPSSTYEIWVYSLPQLIYTGTSDADGNFSVSAPLPADLPPGSHTASFRATGSDGQPYNSGIGFTVAADGTLAGITGPVDVSNLPDPNAQPTLAPSNSATSPDGGIRGAKAPTFAPVNALDAPAAVVTTSIAALALVTVAGAAAGVSGGGSTSRSSSGSSSGGSSGGAAGGGIDAKVEARRKNEDDGSTSPLEERADLDQEIDVTHNRGWRTRFQPRGSSPGDLSRMHRFPGSSVIDELSFVSVIAIAPKSPLLARTIDDAGAFRAIFGSLSLLMPIAGVILGIASAINTGGVAQPPALGLMIALLIIGVFDAFAGLVAFIAFAVGVIFSGGIVDLSSLRTLLGIALLIIGPGLIASSFRDTRRPAAHDAAGWWERVIDLVVVPLLGGWVTLNIVGALPRTPCR